MTALATTMPAAPERRAGERHSSVLMIGRADIGGQEHMCLIHNISARGLMARFAAPPPIGRELVVQCRGLPPTAAVVRWHHGERAGLEFRAERDVGAVLSGSGDRADGAPRTPRFHVALPASLVRDGTVYPATVRDISTGGACLQTTAVARYGDVLRLSVTDCIAALPAVAVWRDEALLGIRFLHPLPLPQLACLLK